MVHLDTRIVLGSLEGRCSLDGADAATQLLHITPRPAGGGIPDVCYDAYVCDWHLGVALQRYVARYAAEGGIKVLVDTLAPYTGGA